MQAAVSSLLQRLRRTVAAFTLAQRTIAVIGLAVLVLGIVALTSWLARPAMTPLFTGLSASDANAVVEQLRSQSVSYELTDGGATVLVPEDAVYEQRLTAASAGLPTKGSDGYTLLDQMGVTTSEFQQSVTYKRAIEGEIARTVAAIDGVQTASVQLAIPEESVFVAETVAPTASVFVETADGAALPTSQVEAIVHLTSAAVSGLSAQNVAVVDQAGRTLSAVGAGATGGIDQQTGDYEARVTASVQQMLDTVVGSGNATVTVSAELDQSSTERLDETYTPAEGVPPSSEQTTTETSTGGTGDAGVLGPDNIAVPAEDGGSTYESTQTTRNNVVNKSVESTTIPAGTLARQTISVAVDEVAADGISVAQLTDLVGTAAGIDAARGDAVTVEIVAFSDTDFATAQAALDAAREAQQAAEQAELVRTLIVAGVVLLAIAGAVLGVVLVRRRRARDAAEPYTPLLGEAPTVDPLLPLSTLTAPTAILETAPEPMVLEPEPGPEPAQISLDRRRAELGEYARRDPERTAELLRSLMRERQDA